jgi:hypothetical protein
VSSTHRPTQKFYLRHNRHWPLNRRVLNVVCSANNTNDQKVLRMHCLVVLTELQYIYNNLLMNCLEWIYCTSNCTKTKWGWIALKVGCVLNHVSKYITKQEKQGTHVTKFYLYYYCTSISSVAFSWLNNRNEGGMYFTQGFMKKQHLVRRAFMYVSVQFYHFKYRNKNSCLEKSVHDLCPLPKL